MFYMFPPCSRTCAAVDGCVQWYEIRGAFALGTWWKFHGRDPRRDGKTTAQLLRESNCTCWDFFSPKPRYLDVLDFFCTENGSIAFGGFTRFWSIICTSRECRAIRQLKLYIVIYIFIYTYAYTIIYICIYPNLWWLSIMFLSKIAIGINWKIGLPFLFRQPHLAAAGANQVAPHQKTWFFGSTLHGFFSFRAVVFLGFCWDIQKLFGSFWIWGCPKKWETPASIIIHPSGSVL